MAATREIRDFISHLRKDESPRKLRFFIESTRRDVYHLRISKTIWRRTT